MDGLKVRAGRVDHLLAQGISLGGCGLNGLWVRCQRVEDREEGLVKPRVARGIRGIRASESCCAMRSG
jgi:hypothetical protein